MQALLLFRTVMKMSILIILIHSKSFSVTIAHDDVTPTQLDSAVRAIGTPVPCTYKLRYVSIGLTGDYGTVLRGKDVAIFDLEQL